MGGEGSTNIKLDDILTTCLLAAAQIFPIVVCIAGDFRVPTTFDSFSYGLFRDVSLMVFLGFGFWMSFLKDHGLTSIGHCLVLSAVAVETSVPVEYLVNEGTKVIGLGNYIGALFCATAVMISFGAVIGKATPFQLTLMTIIEVWVFWVNYRLVFRELLAHDVGGGMFVFLFGAYFGLAVAWWLSWDRPMAHEKEKSTYSSDMFALFGTIVLWVLWPSFMAARAVGAQRQVLAVTQALFALCAATLAFAVVSRFLSQHRFSVVHLQRATLAGAVGMAVIGDVDIGLYGAIIVGLLCGSLCCVGFVWVDPLLKKIWIHDTVGVHNLFGMPGLVAGVTGIIIIGAYGNGEAGKPGINVSKGFVGINADNQVYALLVSLGMALGGGLLAGALMVWPLKLARDHFHVLGAVMPDEELYSDSAFFGAAEPEIHI